MRYRNTLYSLAILLLFITLFTLNTAVTYSGLNSYPIALGYGKTKRFVLYNNFTLYELLGNGELTYITELNLLDIPKDSVIDFEVVGNYVFIYAYKSINRSAGVTSVRVFSLNGEKIFSKDYMFNVRNGRDVYGDMVAVAGGSEKGLALITSNKTATYLIVYEFVNNSLTLKNIYNGALSFSVYKFNGTLLGIVPFKGYFNETLVAIPHVIDLIRNETLFTFPSLIPVVALAIPLVQIYRYNNSWVGYVTVLRSMPKSLEYYIIRPEDLSLNDSLRASVSPWMTCAVLEIPEGAAVIFPDGHTAFISKYVPIIPRGTYMTVDPLNGILDVNPERHEALIKYVKEDVAKIYYLQNKSLIQIYELPAKYSTKISGFYAAILGDYAFMLNPEKHELIKINLTNYRSIITKGKNPTEYWQNTYLWIFIIGVVAFVVFYVLRRVKR